MVMKVMFLKIDNLCFYECFLNKKKVSWLVNLCVENEKLEVIFLIEFFGFLLYRVYN